MPSRHRCPFNPDYVDDRYFERFGDTGSITGVVDEDTAELVDVTRMSDARATMFNFDDGPNWGVEYDQSGRMGELGPMDLHYDEWGRVDKVDHGEYTDGIEHYVYDYRGRLVAELRATQQHDFWLYDGDNPVQRFAHEGGWFEIEEYVWGPGTQQMFAYHDGGELLFPLTDERQSIVGVWNEWQTKLVEYRQYDADGRVRVRDNQDQITCDEQQFDADTCNADWIERFGYTGAMRSTYTGLHRFGERWYASQIGQFVRTDPLWYVDSPDMYGYVGFDPINRWDPTGLAGQSLGDHGRFANRAGFGIAMVRGLGALQVIGGGAEMVAGAVGMGATLEPASTAGGAVLFVHGVDTVNAGMSTLRTGQIQPTLTEQAGRGAAEALGADEQTTSYVGMGLDMSVGIGGSAFVAARPSVLDAFPRFSSLEASQTRYLPENPAAIVRQVNISRVSEPDENLIRLVETPSGRNIRVGTDHGYNRPHGSGDIRDTGLSPDEVDAGLATDLADRLDAGTSLPTPGPDGFSGSAEFETVIDGHKIGYEAVINPAESVPEVTTYYPKP